MGKNWTHKVVKTAGFDFPTAGTFDSEADAISYAMRFAAEQAAAGHTSSKYGIRTRRSFTRNGVKVSTVATVKNGSNGPFLVRW